MESLKASDPQFYEVNRLNDLLGLVRNAILEKNNFEPDKPLHAGLRYDLDLGLAELKALETTIVTALEGQLSQVLTNKLLAGSWAEFIEGLEKGELRTPYLHS